MDNMNSRNLLVFCAIMLLCHLSGTSGVSSWNKRQLDNIAADYNDWPIMACPKKCRSCDNVTKVVNCVDSHLSEVPPDLPTYTKDLLVYGNQIKALNESTFTAVPHLQYLDLRFNKIKTIGNNSFLPLRHLVFLDFSSNPTSEEVLANELFCELRSTAIKELIFSPPRKSHEITPLFFNCLRNTTVENLTIMAYAAGVFHLPNNALSNFRYLKQLTIKNTITYKFNTLALEFNTQLQKLILQENRLGEVPVFTKRKKNYPEVLFPQLDSEVLFPQLEYLDLSKNSLQILEKLDFDGLPSLEVLILSHNDIKSVEKSLFPSLSSLRALYLNDNKLHFLSAETFQFSNIRFLQLENNNLHISTRNQHIYRNMNQVEALYLSDNFNVMEGVFQNITSLRLLSLKHLTMTEKEIPRNAFLGLYNLTTLFITNSKVSKLDKTVFRDLYTLKKLYLYGNEINIVNITSFPQHVWDGVELLSMAGNDFVCTCDLLWFIDWIKDNRNKVENIKGHRCKYPYQENGVPITESKVSEDICIKKHVSVTTMLACVLSSMMLVTVVVISAYVRYRWYLRYKLYHLSLWMKKVQGKERNIEQTREFTYDAFVCYNHKDSEWVHTFLTNQLEKASDPPFKLCLHQRDWEIGQDIMDCIHQSMENSRKILLIVTNAFAESQWCQMEIMMAQHHVLETDNDKVLMAVMEDITPGNMTPRLALEMKRKVHLMWSDDVIGQKLFWQQLKHFLVSDNICFSRALPPREPIQNHTGHIIYRRVPVTRDAEVSLT